MVYSTSGDKAGGTASNFIDVLRFFCFETIDGFSWAWLVLFGGIFILDDDIITKTTNTLILVIKQLSTSGLNGMRKNMIKHLNIRILQNPTKVFFLI